MLIESRIQLASSGMTGLVLLLVVACSSGGERRVPADRASLGSASAAVGDTAPASTADTAQPPTDTTRVKPESAAAAKPAGPSRKIRPSIDPGRKAAPPAAAPAPAAESATAAPQTPPTGQNQSLKYDSATNTVTFELIGGPSGFQFNGYASGGATLTLPPKANVVINFVNKDGTPHSAEVISGEGALPNSGGDAAIPRAYTNQLLQGLPQEAGDAMRFQAPDQGTYRIFCGVPGHGLSGMWIWMKVDPNAKAPSFGPTKA